MAWPTYEGLAGTVRPTSPLATLGDGDSPEAGDFLCALTNAGENTSPVVAGCGSHGLANRDGVERGVCKREAPSDDLAPRCGVGSPPDDPTGRMEGAIGGEVAPFGVGNALKGLRAVSYTHLTLPTILLV